MQAVASIRQELKALSDPDDAFNLQRFFKKGPGEYGEEDQFRGIRVPVLRKLACGCLTTDDRPSFWLPMICYSSVVFLAPQDKTSW